MRGWFPRLLVVTATSQLAVFALRPVITYQALSLGASAAELGLVVASFSVLSLLVAIPVGRAIDRRGELGFLMGGPLLLVAAVLMLVSASHLWVLSVASATLGLGQVLATIAGQTMVANGRDAARRDERFAHFTLVTSVAQFAAPALAGLLVAGGAGAAGLDLLNVQIFVGTAAVISLVAAVTITRRPGALSLRPQHFGKAEPGAMKDVLSTPSVGIALVVGFSVLSASDLLVAFMPALGEDRGLSPTVVGLLIAAHGLASIVVRLCLPFLLRRFDRRALLTPCLGLAALALATVPFVPSVAGVLGLMLLSGAGLGLCAPIAIAWVAGAVRPEVRGTAMSVRMAGNRLGQTLVPLGVASLAGAAGVAAAFVGPAGLLLFASALVHVSGRGDERPD